MFDLEGEWTDWGNELWFLSKFSAFFDVICWNCGIFHLWVLLLLNRFWVSGVHPLVCMLCEDNLLCVRVCNSGHSHATEVRTVSL